VPRIAKNASAFVQQSGAVLVEHSAKGGLVSAAQGVDRVAVREHLRHGAAGRAKSTAGQEKPMRSRTASTVGGTLDQPEQRG